MNTKRMSDVMLGLLGRAAERLDVADPRPFVGRIFQRSFSLPADDDRYARNILTPGAAPLEPSFSEEEPNKLRFTMEPVPLDASPHERTLESSREMRNLVGPLFGPEALRWFDARSEEWRGITSPPGIRYGAFFGTSYDRDGLSASKVYYEMTPNQIHVLPPTLATLAWRAMQIMPRLIPIFTSITCSRNSGRQRITFAHVGALSLNNLLPLMRAIGLERQHPKLMQVFGLALGGRFELPTQSVLLGLGLTETGPEMEFYVLLGMIPDLPSSFLELVNLGLAERPRELRAFRQWLNAFTPEESNWPGEFSVMSVLLRPGSTAKVSLYLRPMEFEFAGRIVDSELVPSDAAVVPA